MDPTRNLSEQLSLARMFVNQAAESGETRSEFVPVDAAARLGELVLALHDWMSKGGFKPEHWSEYENH